MNRSDCSTCKNNSTCSMTQAYTNFVNQHPDKQYWPWFRTTTQCDKYEEQTYNES